MTYDPVSSASAAFYISKVILHANYFVLPTLECIVCRLNLLNKAEEHGNIEVKMYKAQAVLLQYLSIK